MSWDDDDADVRLPTAIPAPPVSAAYDDEEDVTLREERLRAEAEKAKATAAPEAPETMKEKHRMKELQKEKDRKEAEAREKARRELEANKPLADKFAEKARQERLVQEADLAAAMDSLGFGGSAAGGAGSAAAPAAVPRDAKSLVSAVPLTDAKSFEAFAGEVTARMVASSNGPTGTANAMAFYKALLRAVPDKLTTGAINELMTILSTIQTKKRAAEKPKKGGKPAPRLGRAGGIGDDDYSADFGDDYGDLNDEEAAAASSSKGAGGGGWRADDGDFM